MLVLLCPLQSVQVWSEFEHLVQLMIILIQCCIPVKFDPLQVLMIITDLSLTVNGPSRTNSDDGGTCAHRGLNMEQVVT